MIISLTHLNGFKELTARHRVQARIFDGVSARALHLQLNINYEANAGTCSPQPSSTSPSMASKLGSDHAWPDHPEKAVAKVAPGTLTTPCPSCVVHDLASADAPGAQVEGCFKLQLAAVKPGNDPVTSIPLPRR